MSSSTVLVQYSIMQNIWHTVNSPLAAGIGGVVCIERLKIQVKSNQCIGTLPSLISDAVFTSRHYANVTRIETTRFLAHVWCTYGAIQLHTTDQ